MISRIFLWISGFYSPDIDRAILPTPIFALKIEFSNILGSRIFFLKKIFVVKISTTKNFFQKKIPTPQNVRKPDFEKLIIWLFEVQKWGLGTNFEVFPGFKFFDPFSGLLKLSIFSKTMSF